MYRRVLIKYHCLNTMVNALYNACACSLVTYSNILRYNYQRVPTERQYTNEHVYILYEHAYMYCLINEQECFIRFKATSAQREWL